MEEKKKQTRTLEGVVVSDKMQKTCVVAVTRLRKHPLYHKYMKLTKRYKAHDEENACRMGDRVTIQESNPKSKDKRWAVAGIVEKARVPDLEE